MKHFLLMAVAMLVLVLTSPGQVRSVKRGLAYGENSKKDLQALTPGVSWWYNWYHQPENTAINDYKSQNIEYVTMAWNGNFNKTAMRTYLLNHPDVKYILGWNEPNFIDQANMTPSEAAARWKDIEALADEFKLKIGGPAVNYCGKCVSENGVTYTDPFVYLDDFFKACSTCRVDFIAIHCYMSDLSALTWYVSQFERYNKPIWLTEFASWDNNPTAQQQLEYLVDAVDYLENNPKVEKYAWFTGRSTGFPYNAILTPTSGELTQLGNLYVNMPTHNATAYATFPGRIEAEAYTTQTGTTLDVTQDATGFVHVSSLDNGDLLHYNIDVQATDTYPLKFRVASKNAGSLKIIENNQTLLTVAIPAGGDVTKWQTVSSSLKLSAGKHVLRIQAATGGFNFNWFEGGSLVVGTEPAEPVVQTDVYPNPTEETIHISNAQALHSVELISVYGQTVYSGAASPTVDCSPLDPGLYILKLTAKNGGISTRKIVKK